MSNYVIYQATTGVVSMLIQTSDPVFLQLNTPAGCKYIETSITNLTDIAGVDPANETIILAG
ncbi:hypothetical protein SAMN05216428_1148 [Nitrosospira sp. Nsp11]|uniref:hypothetical protein n=1 Tax=Nitrosospira sp. Nsp11 TaxID=1855338 RepID=UPI0009168A19|nr:hypothetical protein [Nitrosospira sp. Nsp11]SHM10807.1 hypothetical protein SAMN05216428_1148 [Nitrosospira sp. Nsp11]